VWSCGGDGLVLPEEGAPANIEVVSGNGQGGIAGTALSQPLVVEVTDTRGRPVAAVVVEFTVQAGGGQVTPTSGETNAEGQAATNWTLGPGAGAQRVMAKVGEASTSSDLTVNFDATAVSGSGALLELVSGDDQTGSVGSPLSEPLVVRVRDGFGNPVSGIEVVWTVSAGSTDPTSSTTDAEGRAAVTRILGPAAGDQTAQADAAGLAGSPITFIHHAVATTPTTLVFSQEPLNGTAGANLTPAVKVAVRDADGNTVTSSTIPITVALGANPAVGTLSGTTTVNAAAGVATFSNLSIDKVGNGYTLVANGGGLPEVTSAPFDIASGTGNRLVFTAQPTSQVVGGTLTPPVQVTVQDAVGNTVTSANTQITLVLGDNPGGATISPSPARVNAVNGVATFSNLRLNHAGSGYTLVALASGLASAGSTPFNITQAATTTTISSKSPSGSSVVGQSVTVNFDVDVVAPGSGTPTGNVTVTDGATSCVGTVAAGSCSLTFSSVGSRTLIATYSGTADFAASSSGDISHTVNKANTNVQITSDSPDPSAIGDAITVAFTVTVNSPGGGTPTGTVTVVISGGDEESCSASVSAGSCTLTPLSGSGGNRTVTATYSGDANYNADPTPDTESHSIRVPTTTTVTSSTGTTVFGQNVTFTATVASSGGTPTGSVQFKADGVNIGGPVNLSNGPGSTAVASRSTTTLNLGSNTITADYIPTGNFLSSNGTLPGGHQVNQAATSTTITDVSPEPSTVGGSYSVDVDVNAVAPGSGTPTGSVTVSDGEGGSCSGTLSGGSMSCSLSTGTAGSKTLTATYGGETRFAGSAGTAPHQVNAPPVAQADARSVPANLPFGEAAPGVLANDTDPEGDALSAVLNDNASNGSVLLNANGGFLYTPNLGFTGQDSFTYHAEDPFGGSSAVVTVTLTVGP
jgi:large repetitive protein